MVDQFVPVHVGRSCQLELPSWQLVSSFPVGPVQRMDPLTNLQVAVKNSVDIFYFSCTVPMNVLFVEDGQIGKSSLKMQFLQLKLLL